MKLNSQDSEFVKIGKSGQGLANNQAIELLGSDSTTFGRCFSKAARKLPD